MPQSNVFSGPFNLSAAEIAAVLGYTPASTGANTFTDSQLLSSGSIILGSATSSGVRINRSGTNFEFNRGDNLIGANTFQLAMTAYASASAHAATAIPAGGTTGAGFLFSSTANFGVFFGSGAPSLSAAKGSLYLRSDGSGAADRAYINTDGAATWTAVATAG